MITAEPPTVSPSSSRIGNVTWAPRVSQSAVSMWAPGGIVFRSCSTPL